LFLFCSRSQGATVGQFGERLLWLILTGALLNGGTLGMYAGGELWPSPLPVCSLLRAFLSIIGS
jgi:hypothetical protein